MENGYESEPCFGNTFRFFVFVVLSLLLGLQVYPYLWSTQDGLEGDLTDVKFVIMQLTKGLSEVNRKHERLQGEIRRISEALPGVSAAAARARDSLETVRHTHGLTVHDQERQSKHERLQGEIRRISEALPGVSAAAARARDSLETARHTHALTVHDQERQVADFALETAGARVIDTGSTVEYFLYESPVGWLLYTFSSVFCRGCLGAAAMIQPGVLPGECWAFKGSKGEAVIRLIGTVHISSISLEHIPAHISPRGEISSAPRLFQLHGLETRYDPNPHDFGTFEYDKDDKPNQYFEVNPATKGYNLVRLRIFSNWGHSEYTCVYRFRVHGQLDSGYTSSDDEEDLQVENES